MAAINNHKMVLLLMMRELLLKTDEEHTLNASDLIRILKEYGYEADRRTIYSNVEILQDFGLDLLKKEDAPGYYIASREFELPELKLLVDAVQSSKFISEKKSGELISKLMQLTSEAKAGQLNRSVFIRNRQKTGNEKVYYSVDTLHEAMNEDRQITFRYGEWTPARKLRAKRNGEIYTVSPWSLTWDDENYYLIAFDEKDSRIKHFRVDKMMDVGIKDSPRGGRDAFKDFDLPAFMRKTFGMFGGKDAEVRLRCENHLAGVIIDRFGSDLRLIPDGDSHFMIKIPVSVSPQFYGWLAGLGTGIEIAAPETVREAYLSYIREILKNYGEA